MPNENFTDRYQFDGEIARGGMGVVLRVKDRLLDRTLALKRMLSEESSDGTPVDDVQFERFLEEAQITAQLDHPSIVPIHELGADENGATYYTMRLVKGHELGEVIQQLHPPTRSKSETCPPKLGERRGIEWTLQRALGVMVRVCQAIAYAHGKGVIHRDLKPANIMVGDLGEVYVMDWGLAKMAGRKELHDIRLRLDELGVDGFQTVSTSREGLGSDTLDSLLVTMDGAVVGTPAYMPPEQAAGKVDEVDQRSDIYALGAILYEMLTGHPPYMSNGKDTTPRQVLTDLGLNPPERVRGLNAEASVELVAICEKAMERDSSNRYQSCIDLAEDLQAYLDQRVVKAYRTGAWVEAGKWVQRNRATAMAGVVAVVVGLMALVLETRSARKLSSALEVQQQATAAEAAAKEQTVLTLADFYAQQGLTAAAQGNSALGALWFVHAAQLSTNAPQARETQLFRAHSWARNSALPWRSIPLRVTQGVRLRSDPSERFLSVDAPRGGGHVVDLEDERILSLGAPTQRLDSVSLHPSQQQVAVSSQPGIIEIRSLSDQSILRELDLGKQAGKVSALAFNRDGSLLFVGTRQARLWDLETGNLLPIIIPHAEPPVYGLFSPDDQLLMTLQQVGEEEIQSLSIFAITNRVAPDHELEPLFTPVDNLSCSPMFAGRGSRFYHSDGSSKDRPTPYPVLRDSRTGEKIGQLPGARPYQIGPAPGSEEDQSAPAVVIGMNSERIHKLSRGAPIPDDDGLVGRISRNDHVVALGHRPVEIVSQQEDSKTVKVDNLFKNSSYVTFFSNANFIATIETYGLLRLWKLPKKRAITEIPKAYGNGQNLIFHPSEPVALATGSTYSNRDEADASANQKQVSPFNFKTGTRAGQLLEPGGWLLHSAFSHDGKLLATASTPGPLRRSVDSLLPDGRGGNVQVWDWESRQRRLGPIPMPSEPRAISFHPDGWMAVICAGGEVVRVDSKSGAKRLLFSIGKEISAWHFYFNGLVRFTSDARFLLAMSQRVLQVWDIEGEKLIGHHTLGPPQEWAFFENMVGAGGEELQIVDVGTGERFPDLGHPGQRTLQFATDGIHCLTSGDMGARVWNWRTGEIVGRDRGVNIKGARWIPGTPWCVTLAISEISSNKEVQFWHALEGRSIAPPIEIIESSNNDELRVSPDGTHALVFGPMGDCYSIDLTQELQPPSHNLNDEDLQLLAEINASARIQDGGAVQLSEREWEERWGRFRALHPGFHVVE